jgi:hypothetical protein
VSWITTPKELGAFVYFVDAVLSRIIIVSYYDGFVGLSSCNGLNEVIFGVSVHDRNHDRCTF